LQHLSSRLAGRFQNNCPHHSIDSLSVIAGVVQDTVREIEKIGKAQKELTERFVVKGKPGRGTE